MDVSELVRRYSEGERDFRGAELPLAEFGQASLYKIDLSGARLQGAYLSGVNLSGANLSDADLSRADLRRANLTDTNFSHANLTSATLKEAVLLRSDFSGASLNDAALDRAYLRDATLTDADLTGASLTRAVTEHTNFHNVILNGTSLVGAHLSHIVRGVVRHRGPSQVDWTSVVTAIREPRLKAFLRGIGMPDVFVEYMVDCARSLDPELVFSLLQSTFISYGGPDEPFARKLNDALERRGVTTFFFKDDAPPGERLHRVMRKGVNDHDRTILICSEASLQRTGLLNELEETLAREARDGGRTYLIPVRLDDYVLKAWAPENSDLAQTVRDRVISDFRRHEDAAEFDAEVAKLIAVLKKPAAAK